MIKKLLLTALLVTSINSFSEVPRYSYVADRVDIPVRANKAYGNNILLMLPSGERLQVLENGEDGWSRIRYGTTEGWMISRYIMVDISAREKLKQLENENKLLSKKINKPSKTSLVEYKQKRSIWRQQAEINYLNKKLKVEKARFEKYKDKQALKSIILLEKSQEVEVQMEDLLNKVKSNYIKSIVSRIKKQWRFHGAKDNWSCDVYILQDLNGKVQSVKLKLCNVGNSAKEKAFKDSIERSVYKASPLPKAPIKEVFDKEILFHFSVK